MTALPMTKNAVPWKAVKILNTKKDARLGARAVPIEKAVKRVALATDTCDLRQSDDLSIGQPNSCLWCCIPIFYHRCCRMVRRSMD